MTRWMLLVLILPMALGASTAGASEIAVTFDDLPVVTAARDPIDRQQEITRKLMAALVEQRIPAAGFVNADKLLSAGLPDPERLALLAAWLDAGMELGNHTFAHRDLHRIPVAEFLEGIERGDAPLRSLLSKRDSAPRWFRHPFLHTGRTAADRAKVDETLARLGYRVAPVTIDNSEWIFARAWDNARENPAQAKRVADEYVRYMAAKVAYYEKQSQKLFGRKIRQVLLVHANGLNAEHFGRLAAELRKSGHTFIPLERALEDDVYRSADSYFGPAGISWLDRWALTRGVPRGFFADEPRTERWILELAGIDEE